MVGPPRLSRRNAQVIRSQFALEFVLSAIALGGAFVVLRLVFKLLSISERVWTGSLVYGVTDRLLWPLTLLPGAERTFLGQVTLKELTAVALFMMIPLALVGRERTQRG